PLACASARSRFRPGAFLCQASPAGWSAACAVTMRGPRAAQTFSAALHTRLREASGPGLDLERSLVRIERRAGRWRYAIDGAGDRRVKLGLFLALFHLDLSDALCFGDLAVTLCRA